jgi:hypothetical protein
VFHVDDNPAKFTPAGTSFLQNKVEDSHTAQTQLARCAAAARRRGEEDRQRPARLRVAPPLHPDGDWINSAVHARAVARQGRHRLWTYSCINCLRTSHLKSWYTTYHKKGL